MRPPRNDMTDLEKNPAMTGSMQHWPLLIWKLIDHAALNHPATEIVTRTVEGPLHRSTWAQAHTRAKRVAGALRALGVQAGDRVGTLAWNTVRHLECWYGISGMGAVAHTINPRLFVDQIVYIVNHARDRVLFFDLSFVDLVRQIAPRLETVEHFVILTDGEHMPPQEAARLLCYEDLLAMQNGDEPWAELDENSPAGLCYTSGTTGNPKGVLYTHRSTVLHAWSVCQPDLLGMSARTSALPVVPMFHANAWGIPHAAAAVGAKLVMPGPDLAAPALQRLIVDERVTLTAAVPTVWLAVLAHLEREGGDLGVLERLIIGGAAAPPSMIEAFEQRYGVSVAHMWGATELSPVGSSGMLCASAAALSPARQLELKCTQGRAPFGVEMVLRDDEGRTLPRDGVQRGRLAVRGPWVVDRYFDSEGGHARDRRDADDWFDTGDIATIDERGYMRIVDRAKDVIKSGGEWISSIELENAAMGCPGVAEVAVIGVDDPKWGERPAMLLTREAGAAVAQADVKAWLRERVAKWWMPEHVIFIESMPHTATGKIMKTALREQFGAAGSKPEKGGVKP
ncbi:fatty-acyl-CoA synthase [Paraburkholderia unamae]|uniref:Fatty-acyl-CoA synthase n=2 Tax=Paraburkholderia unamae TaxID=219649 RepID=A0ABX5K7B4_9BURK|nr:fatty-acyl-CoA synthase [Paraburkholderia unamae]